MVDKQKLKVFHGVIFGILAALLCSAMGLQIKLIAKSATVSMMVFARFTISLLSISLVLIFRQLYGASVNLRTRYLWLHLLRTVSVFIAIYSLYRVIQYVPLTDATVFSMTYTFFVPLLGMIFWGTKTNLKQWGAILVGFIGVVLIIRPFSHFFNPISLLALVSGVANAISMLCTHELGRHDNPHIVLFYSFAIGFCISGLASVFDWSGVDGEVWSNLLVFGVTSTAYQWFLIKALLCSSPKVISPILYLGIVFSGIFDWLLWGYFPTLAFIIGMGLIVLGATFSLNYNRDR